MNDLIQISGTAAAILWADGLQYRKQKILPGVSNQDWPSYTDAAFEQIHYNAVRLATLEELINGNHLYTRQVKAEYERRVDALKSQEKSS